MPPPDYHERLCRRNRRGCHRYCRRGHHHSLQNRTQHRIRLYGVDCPEKPQAFGKKAKRFISGLVYRKKVRVVVEDIDRYGRAVGSVYAGGTFVNEEMVRNGYAWVYRKYCKRSFCSDWLTLERQARQNRLGLWKDKDPIPPWDFRHGNKSSSSPPESPAYVHAGGYHGNVRSHVFHKPGCGGYNCKNCTAIFKTRQEAIEAGYRPCGTCRP
ncbi:MAG: thermonuclease family protein [Syntrophorhabdus sp.]